MKQNKKAATIIMFWLLFSFHAIAQKDCSRAKKYMADALNLDTRDGYLDAIPVYRLALEEYKECGSVEGHMLAYLYLLNALDKTNQLATLKTELQSFDDGLNLLIDSDNYTDEAIVMDQLSSKRFWLSYYLKKSLPWRADDYLTEVIEIVDAMPESIDKLRYRRYNQMDDAEIKSLKGQYKESIEANAKAFDITDSNEEIRLTSEENGVVILPLIGIVKAYQMMGDTTNVVNSLSNMRAYLSRLTIKKDERTYDVYQAHLDYYLSINNQDSSQKYLQQILAFGKNKKYTSEILSYQALYRLQYDQWESVNKHVPKIIAQVNERDGMDSNAKWLLNLKYAERLYAAKEYARALAIIDEAFELNQSTNRDSELATARIQMQTSIIDFYKLKSLIHLNIYQESEEVFDLETAWSISKKCAEIIQRLRTTYTAASDRMTLIDQAYQHYETSLTIAHEYYAMGQKNWIDTAAILMEQCKSLNLLDETRQAQQLNNTLLSATDRTSFEKLFFQINEYQYQIAMLRTNPSNGADSTLYLESKLSSLRDSLRLMESRLGLNASERNETNTNDLYPWSFIKSDCLEKGTSFVEYFTGTESLFCVATNGSEDSFIHKEISSTFNATVGTLIKNISDFANDLTYAQIDTLRQSALSIYEQIFQPIDINLSERILIIPDGALRKLPFSCLLTKEPVDKYESSEFPFLLYNHAISYGYSFAINHESRQNDVRRKMNIDMVAPVFFGQDTLYHSVTEAKEICASLNCNSLINEQATKENTIKTIQASEQNILHLSTHAIANREIGAASYIRFYDAGAGRLNCQLSAYELSTMKLPYHMAVLSACETAAGESIQGEGIVGLSRSIFQAGVESIVATLWQVNERSSKNLFIEFYDQLNKGLPKDVAIQQAQINYLKKARIDDFSDHSHPFYWAALIPVGNMDGFKKEPSYLLLFIGLVSLLSIIGIFILSRRKKV